MNQNELAHFGILGMHWGVRRYQKKLRKEELKKSINEVSKELDTEAKKALRLNRSEQNKNRVITINKDGKKKEVSYSTVDGDLAYAFYKASKNIANIQLRGKNINSAKGYEKAKQAINAIRDKPFSDFEKKYGDWNSVVKIMDNEKQIRIGSEKSNSKKINTEV